MRCLVTGGAGFIGSNLALELEKQGHKVIVIDNLFSGVEDNLKDFKGKFLKIDISEMNSISGYAQKSSISDISKDFEIDEKLDVIFHIAAITDPRFDDEEKLVKENVDGFKNILELAKKNNAKLIYASTANLYGNGPIPMKEDQPKEIITEYGKSKLIMDEMASHHFDDMHIVGLRYFNVFGPRESHKGRPASMIYHLRKSMLKGENPKLFKMGEQVRDHIYIKDVIKATILALDAKKSGVYNVGTGIGTSFNEIVKILNKVLGKNLEIDYIDNPYDLKTYQSNTQADTARAEKFLNFKADYSFEDGVKEYDRWLEENE
jgi:ADP-L-glycero-D-manno-heptose 6-epimerase